VQSGHVGCKITVNDEKVGVVAWREPALACADPACLCRTEVAVAGRDLLLGDFTFLRGLKRCVHDAAGVGGMAGLSLLRR
jgi:hypothetical protein